MTAGSTARTEAVMGGAIAVSKEVDKEEDGDVTPIPNNQDEEVVSVVLSGATLLVPSFLHHGSCP